MRQVVQNNLKVLLIFFSTSMVLAIPVGLIIRFGERNSLGMKVYFLIILFTFIALAVYFILGRVLLAPQMSLPKNLLSTVSILAVFFILALLNPEYVFAFFMPSIPIMALLSGLLSISQLVSITAFAILSWLIITVGLCTRRPLADEQLK